MSPHQRESSHTNAVDCQCQMLKFGNKPWPSKYCVPHSTHTSSVGCVTIHYCTLPSGWLDCRSACCSIWPWGPSARAVWHLWGRLPAQEEGEGLADCKWQWMKWQSVPVVYSSMCVWHTEWHDTMSFDVVVSGHYAYTKNIHGILYILYIGLYVRQNRTWGQRPFHAPCANNHHVTVLRISVI